MISNLFAFLICQWTVQIWTYLRVVEKEGAKPSDGTKVDIVLPTGAMGNIAGMHKVMRLITTILL